MKRIIGLFLSLTTIIGMLSGLSLGVKAEETSAVPAEPSNFSEPNSLDANAVIEKPDPIPTGTGRTVTEQWDLEYSETINGDLYIDIPNQQGINLNGHTLTVNGNVYQEQGMLWFYGGILNVKGNYIITNRRYS